MKKSYADDLDITNSSCYLNKVVADSVLTNKISDELPTLQLYNQIESFLSAMGFAVGGKLPSLTRAMGSSRRMQTSRMKSI